MNSHLPSAQFAFVVLNMAGASMAVVINFAAYRRTGRGGPQAAYAIVSALAAVYVVAYAVLGFADIFPADWSAVMRGVSVLTWPLVWSIHAAAKVFSKQSQRWADAVLEVVQHRLDEDV